LFIILINELVDNCNNGSDVVLHVDDAKLFRHIHALAMGDLLQKDVLDIQLWMAKWLIKWNIKNVSKFHISSI